jgi:hypothetical protein
MAAAARPKSLRRDNGGQGLPNVMMILPSAPFLHQNKERTWADRALATESYCNWQQNRHKLLLCPGPSLASFARPDLEQILIA